MQKSKAKPFYGPGGHALWANTIGVTSLLHDITQIYKYDGILAGHGNNISRVNILKETYSIKQMLMFLDKVEAKFTFSAKVADMFTRPNGVILH
jgi:hypothetical protein